MASLRSSRRLALPLTALLSLLTYSFYLPSRAASSLAAWSLEENGVLLLRTSIGTRLKAFYQRSSQENGDRVWIDFPGELSRPRSFSGNGPIKEIRLGKPKKGITRLVIEFNSSISLDPTKLSLKGTSPDRWALKFVDLPTRGLRKFGEGNLYKASYASNYARNEKTFSSNYSLSDLPELRNSRHLVVIDPGHGGPDPGAVGIGGLRETDVVLDVSLQVGQLLRKKGVRVKFTRTSEIDLDLPPRVALANRSRATAFVSIHANASRTSKKNVNGVETFYYSGYRGKKLSESIQKELLKVSSGTPDRGVRRGRFFVIRRTNMPAALVEIGFLTGRFDSSRLAKSSHRRNIAFALAKGILNYLKGVR